MKALTPRSALALAGPAAALLLSVILSVVAGCTEDDSGGGGCSSEQDCDRGELCEEGSCVALACESLAQCRSGQTCLADLRQCGPKECGGANRCPAERPVCVESGPFRFSCVTELGTLKDTSVIDIADTGADSGGDAGDGGLDADSGTPPDGGGDRPGLCGPCGAPDECAHLGEGATCTPIGAGAFCTTACDPNADDCPAGFVCQAGLDQCLPAGFECAGCLVDGCPAGTICDPIGAECIEPKALCGACTGDLSCQEGLVCGVTENGRYCLTPCPEGGCADGYGCTQGVCLPDSGQCDACGGVCVDPTPGCNEQEARCVACDVDHPCTPPEICGADFTCAEPAPGDNCVNDNDCANVADRPICFGGNCIACLSDADCLPRNACEAQACVPAPCAGVSCQRNSACDPASGRCAPGCQTAMDCELPDAMGCNADTGQCYHLSGACDGEGGAGVCLPGAACIPSPLFHEGGTACSCRKRDPTNFFEPPEEHIIPCPEGTTCFQFGMAGQQDIPDGVCVNFG